MKLIERYPKLSIIAMGVIVWVWASLIQSLLNTIENG